MYKLRYLPLALKDLEDIIDYIADELKAPIAAMDLLTAVESGIERLLDHPYSCRVYQSDRPLNHEYRVLTVKNYLVFYVVLEGIVEIHRVVFGKRNLPQVIK